MSARSRGAPVPDFEGRLVRALRRRMALPLAPATDILRLVHDAADGLPGLVIDVYGSVARVELYAAAYRPLLGDIAEALRACLPGLQGIVGLLRQKRGRAEGLPVFGQAPAGHIVWEDGLRYFVRTAEPEAAGAGIFVDQREGRRRVRASARGRPALNLFAHAGAFGVAAFGGGASRVDHVDSAKKCAPWAALNLALNGGDPRKHRFLVEDAFKVLRRAASRGPAYGVIACDPPTTAINPDGSRFVTREALPALAAEACRALLEGGALLLSTNDRSLPVDAVLAAAEAGAQHAGRDVRLLEEVPLGPDLPPAEDPRVRPMRGAWLVLT